MAYFKYISQHMVSNSGLFFFSDMIVFILLSIVENLSECRFH